MAEIIFRDKKYILDRNTDPGIITVIFNENLNFNQFNTADNEEDTTKFIEFINGL